MSTFNGWIRDPEKIKKALVAGAGNSLVAKDAISVICPTRWFDGHLGHMEEDIRVIGYYAYVLDNKYYAVNRSASFVSLSPSHVNTRVIGDTKYFDFTFDKGEVIMRNRELVKLGTAVYRIYEEFKSKGQVPAYFSPSDLALLLTSSSYYGGVNLATDHAIIEMMASSLPRSTSDAFEHYRNQVNSSQEINYGSPNYIGLSNVAYSTTNTISKFLGNNFKDTLTGALAYPSDRLEPIDELLRS